MRTLGAARQSSTSTGMRTSYSSTGTRMFMTSITGTGIGTPSSAESRTPTFTRIYRCPMHTSTRRTSATATGIASDDGRK